eukprot:TRINITY_DN94460_c0_g1_i1.p1 TRINITY_DN94460_c0_g1~~TRINITY_DN94460_c0_g1_i1.p1  ORF type:complete len:469 (+),score=59.73 TRINITY_DN94460_c0_g1_i1:29-1435(+)
MFLLCVLLLSCVGTIAHEYHPHSEIGHEMLSDFPPSKLAWVNRRFRPDRGGEWSPYLHAGAEKPPTIYPTDYGADPTGKTDSTAAFQKALSALLSRTSQGFPLANGINNLGGAQMDLAGGDYQISSPLVIPNNYGNFLITSGTLRASDTFPTTEYLIRVGNSTCHNPQHSCNENAGFAHLMLDAKLRAAGCIHIQATMGTVVGPQMYFLGFMQSGAKISGGHETMIKNSWFGQYLYSDKRKTKATAIGVEIDGNDHFLLNTIVFSAKIGVKVTGAANLLEGVHTWNLATPFGGVGIYIDAPGYTQNRVLGCYLDYNDLVAVDPQLLSVEQSFFLISANLVIRSGTKRLIQGLDIVGNQFQESPGSIKLNGTFDKIHEVHVERNIGSRHVQITSTKASRSMTISGKKEATFDFSDVLLFPEVKHAVYSVQFQTSNWVDHSLMPIQGNKVTVQFKHPTTATIFMDVDQNQ